MLASGKVGTSWMPGDHAPMVWVWDYHCILRDRVTFWTGNLRERKRERWEGTGPPVFPTRSMRPAHVGDRPVTQVPKDAPRAQTISIL